MKPSAPFPTATQPCPGLHRSWRGLPARKPNRLQTGGRCGVNHSATAIQKWDRQEHGKACGLKARATPSKAMKLTWDAWNRLVKTENANDNSLIASYEYDGLWRRTVKTTTWEKRRYYYNDQWRSIE